MCRIGLRIFPFTAILIASAANAEIPLFAAKCPTGITADSNEKGQVYVNGQVAKVIKRPDGQISANSRGMWVDITPQGNQPPLVTYTAKDKSIGECEVVSFKASGSDAQSYDAKDPVTGYHATSVVPCVMSDGAQPVDCDAGVVREGVGSAMVTIAKPDGRTRTIFFENGRAIGYDESEADPGKFRASKRGDMNIIHIGQERYEFSDALPFGG